LTSNTEQDGIAITSAGVQITGLDISQCRRAISVTGTTTSTIRNNAIRDNDTGVYLAITGGNVLMLNRLTSNASYARQTSLSTRISWWATPSLGQPRREN